MEGLVPTLLVGLGGIGSIIVERVYTKIPVERRQGRIAVHAFDTNINDINQREHLKGNITQTSSDITVGSYLERADSSVLEWFPHEIQLLKRKTMTDGAGQIRCVSRLAYHAAMKEGKLDELEDKIKHIFSASGDSFSSSMRVMIVSSLAGGTGAGIFLQTALYLRELFEESYNKSTVLIRGAFILPDVLIHTKTIPENQWDNVRSNAYACFKELDAITKNADSQTMGNITTSIEFEYRPEQKDQDGQQNYVISSKHLPYDFCFLYDYLSTKGEQINQLEHYIDQMVNTTYLQLFSPLSNVHFSVEDNFILTLIEGLGGNRYCGAGTSILIYPYEDIVDYLSLRWAEVVLSNEWCKIDEDFDAEYRQYEMEISDGVPRSEPKLDEKYPELIKNYATGIYTHPFFTYIHRSTEIIDEDGHAIDYKSNRFVDAIEDLISQVIQTDEKLSQKRSNCRLDMGKLNMRAQAENEVEDMERSLTVYKTYIFKNVQEQKNYVLNQVLKEGCNKPSGLAGDEDFRLNVWILRRKEPLHPVAVRYFLYQVKNTIDDKILRLNNDNKKLKDAINNYKNKYISNEEQIFSAEEYIRATQDQSFFGKIVKNSFKAATDFYSSESHAQLNRLNKFSVDFLKELVFSEIVKNLSEMLDDWKYFFRSMSEIRFKLSTEIEKRAIENDSTSDPTKRFVHASKRAKEFIWEEIKPTLLQGNKLSPEICKILYLDQYQLFCQRRDQRYTYTETIKEINVEQQFRETVVGWCKQTLKKHESININVIAALKKQAQLSKIDSSAKIKEELSIVNRLANPYIYNNSSQAESQAYWGVHPACMDVLTQQDVNSVFGDPEKIIKDEAFSPYEIIRYRNIYGIFAEDIPSFQVSTSGNRFHNYGTYFRAYKQRIDQLEHDINVNITPHLDKRWHKSAFMPDINKEMVQWDQRKTQRAYLLGLIHGRLKKIHRDNVTLWECHTANQGRKAITVGSQKVKSRFYDLYQSMFHNPAHVDIIIEHVNSVWETDRYEKIKEGDIEINKHQFIKGCFKCPCKEGTQKSDDSNKDNAQTETYNILDLVLIFLNEYPNDDDQILPLTQELLKVLLNEIKNYLISVYGKRHVNKAKRIAKNLIKKLCNKSSQYINAKKDNDYVFRRWNDMIKDFITNSLKEE